MAEGEPTAPAVALAPPRPTPADRLRGAPLTLALIAVNAIVFVIAEQHGKTTDSLTLLRFGACERYHVWIGQPWRLATSMFLHVGFVHLAWNAYGGFGWSRRVERALGSARFLVLYLASGIAGSALSVLGRDVISAGASGALFGVIGAELVIRRRSFPGWTEFVNDRAVRSILMSILLWSIIGATAVRMDNLAHFGGLLAGLAIANVALMSRGPRARRVAAAGVAVALCLLVGAAARPRWRTERDLESVVAWAWRRAFGAPALRDARLAAAFGARGCAWGSPHACAALASTLVTGSPEEQRRGVALYRDVCNKGNSLACAQLVVLPPELSGKSRAEVISAYERFCAGGSLDACAAVDFMRAHIADTAEGRRAGADALRAACDEGNRGACWLDGRGTD